MSELKACPFCGYTEMSLQSNGKYVGYECKGCGASPEWDLGESGAREKWNIRPLEDALQRQLDGEITIGNALRHDIELQKQMIIAVRDEYNSLQRKLNEVQATLDKDHATSFKIMEDYRIAESELRRKLDKAIEALRKLSHYHMTAISMKIAQEALKELEK